MSEGESASVAYDDACVMCDGIGYTEYAAYLEGEACEACQGSGKRAKLRTCTVCGRQLHSAREMHWACEVLENENRATASGGPDKHQSRRAAPDWKPAFMATWEYLPYTIEEEP